ncbi:MAG: mechanosensitive ion channel [Candidatus Woesearchaeota archaeon]
MSFEEYIIPVMILLAFYIIGELLNHIITGIGRLTSRTKTQLDDFVLNEIKSPIRFITIFLGLYLAVSYSFYGLEIYGFRIREGFILLAILIVAHVAVRIATGMVRMYRNKVSSRNITSRIDETLIPFIRRAIAMVIYAVAIIIILGRLGIEIGPFLAGLGIAGLAVALALQDTLSNLFSGVYIATDRPIRIGDYIELQGTDLRGYVEDISWRTTKLRALTNYIINVPNSKLAQSILLNYNAPQQEMSLIIPVGVAYGSDLSKVEKVTVNTAKRIQKKEEGTVDSFEPFIRYNGFGDSSINLSVIMRIHTYVDRYKVMHEFIKELHKAYKKNKIEIPFPQTDVWMRKK